MADQELKIRVAAETGAAQDALGKLADEMAGLAKATEREGSEQQKLARQTAQTTAQVQAAREAVERAKRAQQEAAAVTQAFGKDSREAAEATARLKVAQDAATRATRDAERALRASADAVSEAGKAADAKAAPAVRRLNDQLQRAGKDADRAAQELRSLEARIASTGREAVKAGGFLEKFRTGAIMGLGAAAAQSAIGVLGEGVRAAGAFAVDTAANFERLRTALETTTGSQAAANAKFAELQKFAAETPFSLEEVTEGYIKLSNRGVDASSRMLTSLGNTASAMGKTLDDAVEAVADAVTGENERLKEFGIVGRLAGDQVAYTFRGVTTMVKRDAAAIAEYIASVGEANFAGGMEKQAQTLGGLFSTLKDTAAQFADTLMSSGVADVLKDIMREVTGLAGGSSALAKELGGALASGLRTTWELLKEVAPLFVAAAKASKWLFDTIREGLDAMHEQDAAVALFGRTTEVAHDRLREYARAHGEALGPIGEMVQATFMEEAATRSLTEAVREGQRAREDQARTEAIVAGLQTRAAREEAARISDLEKRKASAERSGMMAEYLDLKGDKTLSPSQKKRLGELKKTLDIPDDPKVKRGKKPKDQSRELSLGGLEDFSKRDRVERERAFDEQVRAFEQEQALRERRIAGLESEIDMLSARADRERESVDMILLTVDVESQAAAARDALIDERIRKEGDLAQWELANAKTREQRERAQTRVYEVEAKKRALAAQREVTAEEKEHRRRQQVVERVTGAVMTLGEGMVAAFERMAAGEKGAIASMLSELLKGVAKKHAILALAEAALAVGAAASYRYAAAAQHGTSAALHTGVAIAAGVGAVAAGAVADARAGSGGGGGGASPFGRIGGGGGSSGSAPRSGSSGASGSGDGGLEAQEVPISHEQLRRGSPRGGGGATAQVVISGTVNIYGAGGKAEFVEDIRRAIDRSNRAGHRARN